MTNFVMNRDFVVSGMGHSISFKKGEPQHVPPELHQEAMRCGATAMDDDVNHVTAQKGKTPQVQGSEREKQVIACMNKLVEENQRMSFGADGLPTMKAIFRVTGIDLEMNERNKIWQKRMRAIQAAIAPSSATILPEEVAAAENKQRELSEAKVVGEEASETAAEGAVTRDLGGEATTAKAAPPKAAPPKKKVVKKKAARRRR